MSNELSLLSAVETARLYAMRRLSPVESIQAVIETIEKLNPVLNAFCWLDLEGALKQARASEERWMRGEPLSALDGVSYTVKDLSMTAGWPTRRGSRVISADGPWTIDAPSVARMREAGGVLLGKTSVPEFGATGSTRSALCGTTRNPWNPDMTPGGSSGGSSAAAAAGMGAIALASDAAGSIRTPAAVTGTFGIKTTFGRVPDYPSSYLGSLAVIGPITRTVEDSILCMEVISREDPRDPYALPPTDAFSQDRPTDLSGLRIAFSPTLGFGVVDPEIAGIVARAAERFRELGARVDVVDHVMDDPSAILGPIMLAGLVNAFRVFGFTPDDEAQMHPKLRAYVDAGRKVSLMDFHAAKEKREALTTQMRLFHREYDLLLTPTLSIAGIGAEEDEPSDPRYAHIPDWKPFVAPFNLTCQPAASLPVGLSADGLPVGMQVVGPLYGDKRVLDACHVYEAAFPFARPDLDALRDCEPENAVPAGIRSMREAMTAIRAA
jgi:aspartyl-tRNA(Asn)/glutamyl-tRNA(Gln) amidotransferase subunit A